MRRAVLIAVLVAVVGIAAYAVGTTGDDPTSIERVVIAGTTNDDATRDKWVTAECPDGMTAMSGGAVVPHGNDTPGVAIYWSAPYEDHGTSGWWAAAQDTRNGHRAWLLQVQAICVEGVVTRVDPRGSLPVEEFAPAG
jgi:hypothetical protein